MLGLCLKELQLMGLKSLRVSGTSGYKFDVLESAAYKKVFGENVEAGAGPLVCPGIEGVTSSPGFEMGNQGGSASSVAFITQFPTADPVEGTSSSETSFRYPEVETASA
ncbi:hypothetical protein Acr_00g0101740 [Actinidia rufa]|uniref:Uncharacterized protein n=1 Tax=Actinidia rufa TaxID=165716 RepID=A0A7J0E1W6_9ERIC|nr:hypothetical protein Acr_00g0101740 [Actinidia rufa]